MILDISLNKHRYIWSKKKGLWPSIFEVKTKTFLVLQFFFQIQKVSSYIGVWYKNV